MEKKMGDYWQVVFVAGFAGALVALEKFVKEMLPFNMSSYVLAAVLGGLGALIGTGIYSLVKNKKTLYKILSFVGMFVIILGTCFLVNMFSSDSNVVKKQWKLIDNGNLIFEYPNSFAKLNLGEKPDNIEDMAYFSDKKEDRFAMNLIFDFKEQPPVPEDSLSGAILNPLENIKASEIEWIDSEFYTDAVTTKVKYKIGGKERIGFGVIYFNDWHYEIALFLPYSKNYSEEFLNRIINSVSVRKK